MKKQFTKKNESDGFYAEFIPIYCAMHGFNNPSAEKTLVWFCNHTNNQTRELTLTPKKRKEALQDLEISTSQLSNNLEKLKQAEFISGSYGDYLISENVYWPVSNLTELNNKSLHITFTLE